MLSTVINTNGIRKNVEPLNGEGFSLDELRGFVGGHIEIVRLSKSQAMIVNEEGKIMNLPENQYATMVANMVGIKDTIVGNVLVCDFNKIK